MRAARDQLDEAGDSYRLGLCLDGVPAGRGQPRALQPARRRRGSTGCRRTPARPARRETRDTPVPAGRGHLPGRGHRPRPSNCKPSSPTWPSPPVCCRPSVDPVCFTGRRLDDQFNEQAKVIDPAGYLGERACYPDHRAREHARAGSNRKAALRGPARCSVRSLSAGGCSGVLDPQGPVGAGEKLILLDVRWRLCWRSWSGRSWRRWPSRWWFRASNHRARYLP